MKKIVLSIVLVFLIVGCGSQEKAHNIKENEKKQTIKHEQVVEINSDVKEEIVPKSLQNITKVTVKKRSGESIFKACASCHGTKAEKKALGKSQVIKGWKISKITNALHGYKNGTYGGAMKGLMKGQASKLSNADIKAVAGYISKL